MTSFPRQLGVVGLGLMGASLARAVKAVDPSVRVVAVEPSAEVRAQAVRDGVADEADATPGPSLSACDVAVLCTPMRAIEALLGPVSRLLPDGAVLTDVGGAKERLVERAARDVRPGVAFVAAHPLFGGRGGYAGARADLWRSGSVAVCTDAPAEAVERVARLHAALGARVVRCRAAEHDRAVAMASHLPALLASALALAARDAGPLARELAGPSLEDMTRPARFPFDIHGEVARRNARLAEASERLSAHLARVLAAIATSPEAAHGALEKARAAREALYPDSCPALPGEGAGNGASPRESTSDSPGTTSASSKTARGASAGGSR